MFSRKLLIKDMIKCGYITKYDVDNKFYLKSKIKEFLKYKCVSCSEVANTLRHWTDAFNREYIRNAGGSFETMTGSLIHEFMSDCYVENGYLINPFDTEISMQFGFYDNHSHIINNYSKDMINKINEICNGTIKHIKTEEHLFVYEDNKYFNGTYDFFIETLDGRNILIDFKNIFNDKDKIHKKDILIKDRDYIDLCSKSKKHLIQLNGYKYLIEKNKGIEITEAYIMYNFIKNGFGDVFILQSNFNYDSIIYNLNLIYYLFDKYGKNIDLRKVKKNINKEEVLTYGRTNI